AAGRASAAWTLGAAAGANAATATVAGAGSAAFAATGTARPATPAPTLARVRGDGQTGAAGTTLATPLWVRLTDAEGRPVQGATVAWTVTAGGGSVSPATYTTDAAGEAVTIWTLGPAPGANAVAASVAGVGSVAFTAEARAGTGVMGGMAKELGDGQTGTVGAKLPIGPTVRVTDTAGNPLPGAVVSWAVTGGGGSIGYRAEKTGADGRANAEWILGPAAGPQTLTAASGGFSSTFTATAVAPGAGGLAKLGGDGQTAPIGTRLPQSLTIRVTDAAGNPRGGVAVGWTVTGGGGSFDANTYHSTWPDGTASAGWVLGMTPGPQTAKVSVGGDTLAFGATATPTTFTFTVAEGDDQDGTAGAQLARPIGLRLTDGDGRPVAGATVSWQVQGGGQLVPGSQATGADGIVRGQWRLGGGSGRQSVTGSALGASGTVTAVAVDVAATLARAGGDQQSAAAWSPLPSPLVARLTNARGTPLAGVPVAWKVLSGGGSVTPASAVTGTDGTASASWTLGSALAAQSVTASGGNLAVDFFATAGAPPVAAVEKLAGDGQSGTVAAQLPLAVRVRGLDARGDPVRGAAVAWTASSGGSVASASRVTGDDGGASALWTLGSAAGAQTLTVSVGGVAVVFGATAATGAPFSVRVVSGDAQTAQVGTSLPEPLVVRVVDGYLNPVAGAPVRWSVQSLNGGTLAPASAATAADGTARAAWTLGTGTGGLHAMVRAGEGDGGPLVYFTATATGVPVATVTVSPAAPTVEAGKPVQLTAALADAGGNPLTGRTVAWSSSSAAVATVSGSGLVTGVAPGTATITAASEGKSGSAAVTVVSTGDGIAPELRGFSFTPASVDVSSAAAPVEFSFTAADAGSGVAYANVQVFSPAGSPGPFCSAGPGPGAPSPLGTWKCSAPVPQGSAPGTWYVHSIRVSDAAGNQRTYTRAELQAAGLPTALQVTSVAPDADAPVVAGLAITPTSVDVGAGPAPVEFTVRLTDAGSGARELFVRLLGPDAVQQQSCFAYSPASGSRTDGTWKCTVTVPLGAAPGEWYVGEIRVEDVVLNRRTYSRAMLQAAGLPTAVAVSGPAADATPPVLTGFAIAPATVNLAGGAQTVEFTATATDAGSGFAKLDVLLLDPGVVGRVCVSQALAGGSPQNGTMKCSVSVPGTVASGTQYVDRVMLYDGAGNQRIYTRADLRAAGFPTDVVVTR
ncbi:MAG: Ig-like domain-containing protein, partial [Gemmatimonadota bacterium]